MSMVTIPKNLEKKIKDVSEKTGLHREELFMNAILYYFETMRQKIDLKKELEEWEKASEFDFLNMASAPSRLKFSPANGGFSFS